MRTRHRRPLLAAIVTGALFAGGAVYAGPAFADTATTPSAGATSTSAPAVPSDTVTPSDTPSATPTPTGTTSSATPTPTGTTSSATPTPTQTSSSATPTPTQTSSSATPTPTQTSSPTTPPPTTPVDTKAPSGYFVLNNWNLLYGQSTTLSIHLLGDDQTPWVNIRRLVDWGDGTSSELTGTQTALTHKYFHIGSNPVTLQLIDAAGNTSTLHSAGPKVTNPSHIWFDKKGVFPGQTVTFAIQSVPAGISKIAISFGDGYVWVGAGKAQVVKHTYYRNTNGYLLAAGSYQTINSYYFNSLGASGVLNVGKVGIYNDSYIPTVRVSTPSNAGRISSWSTIHGTAADAGSGVLYVDVMVVRFASETAETGYCYTTKGTWLYLDGRGDINTCFHNVGVSGNNWSLKISGLKSGVIGVGAIAVDKVGNASDEYDVYYDVS